MAIPFDSLMWLIQFTQGCDKLCSCPVATWVEGSVLCQNALQGADVIGCLRHSFVCSTLFLDCGLMQEVWNVQLGVTRLSRRTKGRIGVPICLLTACTRWWRWQSDRRRRQVYSYPLIRAAGSPQRAGDASSSAWRGWHAREVSQGGLLFWLVTTPTASGTWLAFHARTRHVDSALERVLGGLPLSAGAIAT